MAVSEQRVAYVLVLWTVICLSTQIAESQTYGKTYVVGDNEGWTYINKSSGQPADYSSWASNYTFFVNDVLVFNYEGSTQNVYSFDTYNSWKTCNFTAGQLLDDGSSGFSQWFLPYEGYYDFASGIYCSKGQKFRIYAINASNTGPVHPPTAPASPPAPSPILQAPVSPILQGPTTAPILQGPTTAPILQAPTTPPAWLAPTQTPATVPDLSPTAIWSPPSAPSPTKFAPSAAEFAPFSEAAVPLAPGPAVTLSASAATSWIQIWMLSTAGFIVSVAFLA